MVRRVTGSTHGERRGVTAERCMTRLDLMGNVRYRAILLKNPIEYGIFVCAKCLILRCIDGALRGVDHFLDLSELRQHLSQNWATTDYLV